METEWGNWHLPGRILYDDPVSLPSCAVYGMRHMLARSEKGTDEWFNDVKVIIRHYFIGAKITEQLAELACKTLCQLAVEDLEFRRVFGLAYATLEDMYDRKGSCHTSETLSHGA